VRYIKAAYKINDEANDGTSTFDGVFFLLLVFAFAVRLFQSLNTCVIETDSCMIIETAKTLGNLGSLSFMDFAVNVHPLFPLLIALISKCGIGYEESGKALSILFGTLTLFPVYLASKKAYGRRVGGYSAFLFAIHPYLFVNASNVLRDSTSIFLIVMTFFIAWKAFEEKKDRYLVLAGLTASLAYLTKAEGLFCMIAVLAYIWMRDPQGKMTSIRGRARSTLSFASISLTVAVSLIIMFSVKAHSFSLNPGKPLGAISLFSQSLMGSNAEMEVLGGLATGITPVDMITTFLLIFLEAVFAVYILFLGLNVVRFWTRKALSPIERYYLFIVIALLILEFIYFSQVHVFSRRYFLSIVVLLMGFMGYGLRLLQARVENLVGRRNGSALYLRSLIVIFASVMIIGALIKGSYYWEPKKVSLKVAGRYILSHAGDEKIILTDDPRIAYYANGTYLKLTKHTLLKGTRKNAGVCLYDFIVFAHAENIALYEKYDGRIADSGFVDLEVQLPPGSKNVIILECSKKQ
jgi:hypothetical protein